MVIVVTALKEKIRRKEFYIVTLIGLLILLVFGTGAGSITIGGKPVTGYESIAPILITMINVVCGALAILLSLHTIPNEYERKTSHLIWIRGVSQPEFHGELALANGISSLIAEVILYMGLLVYMVMNGKESEVWRLIPAFLLVAISVFMVSLFTSVLSIVLPGMFACTVVTICYLVGILHGILDVFRNMITGIGSVLLKGILFVIPDLNAIQTQAGNVLRGNPVEVHVIWKGLLIIYMISLLFFLLKKREA